MRLTEKFNSKAKARHHSLLNHKERDSKNRKLSRILIAHI